MMSKFKCNVCGYIYQPALGDKKGNVELGTPFEDLPVEWRCPNCGATQNKFHKDEPMFRE